MSIHVSSTTNSMEEVQAAADHQPTESTSGSVSIVSTTDPLEAVSKASQHYDGEMVVEGEQTIPVIMANVASTTDSEEEVAAVQREMEEAKLERVDYLTHRPRAGVKRRIDELVRQREEARSENEQLRAQLAQQ